MKRKKNSKFISRFLSLLLTLVMVVTMLPAVAKADTTGGSGTTGTTDNSGLVLDKTATLENDGTYTINLEAYATGTTVTTTTDVAVPLDIVMVIDQSGSMKNDMPALKTAVRNFANTIAEKANHDQVDHRIALVGFASNNIMDNYEWTGTGIFLDGELKKYATYKEGWKWDEEKNEWTQGIIDREVQNLFDADYAAALVSANDGTGKLGASIDSAITSFNASGATCINYGMKMTKEIFKNNPIASTENRQRVVVVFSDGVPTTRNDFESDVANDALDNACTIKNTTNDGYGAKIYTVGLYDDPDDVVLKFMNALSSNYQDVKNYKDSSVTTPAVEYNEVYSGSINTDRRYRIKDGASYKTVMYCDYAENGRSGAGWYDGRTYMKINGTNTYAYHGTGTKYTPKTSSNGRGTQFYKKEVKDSVGYLKIASDTDQLNAIFQSISQSATTSSTKVELTANAVMRDILGTGFKLPYTESNKGDNIVVETCEVTMDSSGEVTEGTPTTTSQGLTNTVVVDVAKDYYALDVTGFDYKEKYVSSSHPGEKLKVTIKGVVATDEAITNDLVDTNNPVSGIYESVAATAAVKNFPQPKTILSNKSYVLDYGKKVDFKAGDWKQEKTTHLALDMNGFSQAVNKLTQSTSSTVKYGEAEIATTAQTLTYKPQKINWDGYDSFYAFGKVDKNDAKIAEINQLSTGLNANRTENIWSKINVIPATSVYYEDDFMTSSTSKDGGVKIQYAGDWKVVKDDDTEKSEKTDTTPDSDDKQSSENKVYGFDESYNNQLGHSGGSAHYVTGKWDENTNLLASTATFTFTGTGVDIYSRTTMESGMVQMDVYKGTSVGNDGEQVYVGVENGYWSSKKGLYQIPTLFVKDLAYGTYTVQLTVYAKDEFSDRDVYYLDGIRIYEPLKNPEKTDATIQQAYEEASEGASMIATVREILLSAEKLTQETTVSGIVYMDEVGNSAVIDDYKKVGPKNEVYLSKDNGIAFHVEGMEEDSKVYIGLKAPQSAATTALVTDGDKTKEITINSSADRYYEVTPNTNGNIVIKNIGEGLLSITKIRVTNVETYNDNASIQYTPRLLSDIRKFSSLKQAETVTENKTTQSTTANKSLNVTINQAEPLQENDSKEEEAVWNSIKNSAARWLSRQ